MQTHTISLTAIASVLLLTQTLTANVFITEVVDGTLTGAAPKFVEITNTGLTDYTFGTGGGIIVQANAATDYVVDIDMSGVTIPAGVSFVVSASNTSQDVDFFNVYGFAPDFLGGSATFGNGDDRYAIADNGVDAAAGTLLDIYGVDGVDGSGQAWEYTDSYAYRVLGLTTGNGGTFDAGNWVYGGINALETAFELDNSYDPLEVGLLQTLTTPGAYAVPEPSLFGLLAGISGLFLVMKRRIRR